MQRGRYRSAADVGLAGAPLRAPVHRCARTVSNISMSMYITSQWTRGGLEVFAIAEERMMASLRAHAAYRSNTGRVTCAYEVRVLS